MSHAIKSIFLVCVATEKILGVATYVRLHVFE